LVKKCSLHRSFFDLATVLFKWCCRFHAIAPVRHSFEKAFEFIKGPLDRWLRKISFATLETLRLEVGDAVPIELEQNSIKFL